jgi:hypothetical protein
VPKNVLDTNIQFSGHQHISIEEIPDFMIRAALRKKLDQEFITPLDLPDTFTKIEQPVSWMNKLRKTFHQYKRP